MQAYSMNLLPSNPLTSLANNAVETAALIALKIPGVSTGAYAALQVATAPFPGLLKLSSTFYSKVLNDNSKTQLKEFIEKDELLGPYYKKFIIITLIMEAETADPVAFVKQNQDIAKHFLSLVGVTIDDNFDIETLKTRVNEKIGNIIQFIKGQKDKLYELLKKIPMAGGRTKRIKKRKTRRKGGTLNYLSQMKNKMNFKLWNLKNNEKYRDFNENLYYPNPANRFSLSGQDPKNLSLLGETPQPISWKKRVAKHCLRVGYDDREKCINDNCSPYNMNDPSCNRVIDENALN